MSKQFMQKARTIEYSLRQSIPILLVLTKLQRKTLYHVCTIDNANYGTLTEEIGKDRIAIKRSRVAEYCRKIYSFIIMR